MICTAIQYPMNFIELLCSVAVRLTSPPASANHSARQIHFVKVLKPFPPFSVHAAIQERKTTWFDIWVVIDPTSEALDRYRYDVNIWTLCQIWSLHYHSNYSYEMCIYQPACAAQSVEYRSRRQARGSGIYLSYCSLTARLVAQIIQAECFTCQSTG